jgi:hypothetical protein
MTPCSPINVHGRFEGTLVKLYRTLRRHIPEGSALVFKVVPFFIRWILQIRFFLNLALPVMCS